MKIHPLIAGAVISAMFALQGWTLSNVHDLDVKVARIDQELQDKIAAGPVTPPFVPSVASVPPPAVTHGGQLLVSTPK